MGLDRLDVEGGSLSVTAGDVIGTHVDGEVTGVSAIDAVRSGEKEKRGSSLVGNEDRAAGVGAEALHGSLMRVVGDVGVFTVDNERHLEGILQLSGRTESASNESQEKNLLIAQYRL